MTFFFSCSCCSSIIRHQLDEHAVRLRERRRLQPPHQLQRDLPAAVPRTAAVPSAASGVPTAAQRWVNRWPGVDPAMAASPTGFTHINGLMFLLISRWRFPSVWPGKACSDSVWPGLGSTHGLWQPFPGQSGLVLSFTPCHQLRSF